MESASKKRRLSHGGDPMNTSVTSFMSNDDDDIPSDYEGDPDEYFQMLQVQREQQQQHQQQLPRQTIDKSAIDAECPFENSGSLFKTCNRTDIHNILHYLDIADLSRVSCLGVSLVYVCVHAYLSDYMYLLDIYSQCVLALSTICFTAFIDTISLLNTELTGVRYIIGLRAQWQAVRVYALDVYTNQSYIHNVCIMHAD